MTHSTISDDSLIDRILKGQPDAFETLVARYFDTVRAVAYGHVGNHADADDVAQSTFIKAYRSLATLRDTARFGPWAVRIARNEALTFLRKGRREAPLDPNAVDERPAPSEDVSRRELEREVRDEVMALPEAARDVILLHYFAGKTTKEIAQLLGMSHAAARKRLERARDTLGQRLVARLMPDGSQDDREGLRRIMGAVAVIGIPRRDATPLLDYGSRVSRRLTPARVAAWLVPAAVAGLILFSIAGPTSGKNETDRATEADTRATDTVPVTTAAIADESEPEHLADENDTTGDAPGPGLLEHLPAGVIHGKVSDVFDRPLAGAQVALYRPHDDVTLYEDVPPLDIVTTDAQGRYRFDGLTPGLSNTDIPQYRAMYALIATAPGQIALTGMQLTESRLSEFVVLAMERAATWKGVVTDGAGKPVPGARVYPKSEARDDEKGFWRSLPRRMLAAEADSDGRFTFTHLPEGSWRFLVVAEDYAPRLTAYTPHAEDLAVTLGKGSTVRGRLVDHESGSALSGVGIVFCSKAHFDDRRTVVTSEDGRYAIDGLEGSYRMALEDPTMIVAGDDGLEVAADAGGVSHDMEAAPGAVVTGRVYDADTGAGISGVIVSVSNERDGRYPRRLSEATGPDGLYRVEGLRPSGYRAWFAGAFEYDNSDRWHKRATVQLEDGDWEAQADFALSRGIAIRGRVIDGGGAPVRGAKIVASTASVFERSFAYTNQAGAFTLWGFTTADKPVLKVRSETHASGMTEPLTIPPGGLFGVEIVAHRAATVEGVLVDGSGSPIASGAVSARAVTGYHLAHPYSYTARDGSFHLGGLSAGAYTTDVLPPGTNIFINEPFARFTVEAGQTISDLRVVYDETEGLQLSGRIVDGLGEPIPTAHVSINGPEHTRGGVRPDGTFSFFRLPEGAYSVSVSADGYANTRHDDVAAGSKGIEIVLRETGQVEGVVVDGETGEALDSFDIMSMGTTIDRFIGGWVHQFRTLTNRDGRFSLKDDSASGELTIVARAPGYAMAFVHPRRGADGSFGDISIPLERGHIVEGRVLAPDGDAVQDALVFIGGVPDVPRMYWTEMADTRTDADGRFYLDTAPADTKRIAAFHPDFSPTPAPVDFDSPMTIRLQAHSGVEGFLTLGGEPLADAYVHFGGDNGISEGTRTDERGWFSRGDLLEGDVTVRGDLSTRNDPFVMRSRYAQARIEEGRMTRVDLDLSTAGAALEGRLTYNDTPVPNMGVAVMVELADGGREFQRVRCDATGYYQLDPISEGVPQLFLCRWRTDGSSLASCPTTLSVALRGGGLSVQNFEATGPPTDAIEDAFWAYWWERRPDNE